MKALLVILSLIAVPAMAASKIKASPEVNNRALEILLENSGTLDAIGDVSDDESVSSILTKYIMGLGDAVVKNECTVLANNTQMNCQLSASDRRYEEFIDYSLNVNLQKGKDIKVISIIGPTVTISRGGP